MFDALRNLFERQHEDAFEHPLNRRVLKSWRPEPPDPRDRRFKLDRPAATAPRRPAVLPMGQAIGVRIHDQGMLGSCTGHAATSMVEIALRLVGDTGQLSRLFPYYLGREMIAETNVDNGAYNRDVVRSIVKFGVPSETVWPYKTAKVLTRPSSSAFARAEKFRLANPDLVYERVEGLEAMLSAIDAGHPVMFGFLAFESIFGLNSTNNVMPLPGPNDPPVGGHAVVADGYDDATHTIWVMNSWGTTWGKRGYFRMPYDWVTDQRRLVDDCWTVRRQVPTPAAV